MLTRGLPHQLAALEKSLGRRGFAFFPEPRLGKSWIALADFERARAADLADCLVILAPNGVHRSWVEIEIPKHLGAANALLWTPSLFSTKKGAAAIDTFLTRLPPPPGHSAPPRVVAFNSEAFSRIRSPAEALLRRLCKRFRVFLVIDESDWFATPSATRSRNVTRLAKAAAFVRIMTGTPDAQGPLQYYAQFRILGNELLGFDDYSVFKAHLSEWVEQRTRAIDPRTGKNRTYPKLVRYRNLPDLRARMEPHAFFLKRQDCLALPPPAREPRFVEMTEEQRRLYREAKRRVLIELEGREMTLLHAFTRLLRLRQLTGGFFSADDGTIRPILPNPKLTAVQELAEKFSVTGKVIVWCAFREECKAVLHGLNRSGAAPAVHVTGDVPESERNAAVARFQTDPACRFFVATPAAAGQGRDLSAAAYAIYFSNGYSVRQRIQSEDRSLGIAQQFSLSIVDLICPGTVDEIILSALAANRRLSDLFRGSVAAVREALEAQTEGE